MQREILSLLLLTLQKVCVYDEMNTLRKTHSNRSVMDCLQPFSCLLFMLVPKYQYRDRMLAIIWWIGKERSLVILLERRRWHRQYQCNACLSLVLCLCFRTNAVIQTAEYFERLFIWKLTLSNRAWIQEHNTQNIKLMMAAFFAFIISTTALLVIFWV